MNESEWLKIFGDNLQYIIYESGYSQKELAKATGLSEATISNYINAKRMPTMKAIINLAYTLNLSFDELIDFGDKIY